MCLLVSKLPFLFSNNSLLSTQCKEVANSVDFIYVAHAFENFTSELLFYIFSRLLINNHMTGFLNPSSLCMTYCLKDEIQDRIMCKVW